MFRQRSGCKSHCSTGHISFSDCNELPGTKFQSTFSGLSPGDPEAESHFCGSDRPSSQRTFSEEDLKDYSDTLSCSERGLKATPALSHREHARREACKLLGHSLTEYMPRGRLTQHSDTLSPRTCPERGLKATETLSSRGHTQ